MFEVPASKRSIKQNRFEFSVDGKTYDIPLLKFIPAGAIAAFEQEKRLTGLIIACENEGARAAVESLDAEQLEALIEAWQEASGITVGESGASSSS